MRTLVVGLGLLVLAGCGPLVLGEGGPAMAPGQNCLTCHSGGENAFTAAGTIFTKPDDPTSAGLAGATVILTDATGQQVTLTTNSAGNFYTSQPLTFPLSAELRHGTQVATMVQRVPSGGCAACHSTPPANGAPGRPFISP